MKVKMTGDNTIPWSESVSGSQSFSRFGASSTGYPIPVDTEFDCDSDTDSDHDGCRPLPAKERKP